MGRGSGVGVARAKRACVCHHRSPQRKLGDCDEAHHRTQPGSNGVVYLVRHGWRGGICSRSPRARARGLYGGERQGSGLPVRSEPASQASERQDAEASLRGVSAGQDARSERPARWHGQPRPTQEVASSALSPALQASERQDAEASLRGVSEGQDARSERPARWHGQPRPTQGGIPNRCVWRQAPAYRAAIAASVMHFTLPALPAWPNCTMRSAQTFFMASREGFR